MLETDGDGITSGVPSPFSLIPRFPSFDRHFAWRFPLIRFIHAFRLSTRHLVNFTALCGIASCLGCGPEGPARPEVARVSGVVMYNGDPVAGATVEFMSDNAPRAATGVTNSEGEFKLSMFGANDGAVLGTNKVTIKKVEGGEAAPAADPTAALDDPTALTGTYTQQMGPGGKPQGPKSLLPTKYGDAKSTPLSEEVKAGEENRFVFQLTD
jgi:hypothetical protein